MGESLRSNPYFNSEMTRFENKLSPEVGIIEAQRALSRAYSDKADYYGRKMGYDIVLCGGAASLLGVHNISDDAGFPVVSMAAGVIGLVLLAKDMISCWYNHRVSQKYECNAMDDAKRLEDYIV